MAEIIAMMIFNQLPRKFKNTKMRNDISSGRYPKFFEKECKYCNQFCHRSFRGKLIFNIVKGSNQVLSCKTAFFIQKINWKKYDKTFPKETITIWRLKNLKTNLYLSFFDVWSKLPSWNFPIPRQYHSCQERHSFTKLILNHLSFSLFFETPRTAIKSIKDSWIQNADSQYFFRRLEQNLQSYANIQTLTVKIFCQFL